MGKGTVEKRISGGSRKLGRTSDLAQFAEAFPTEKHLRDTLATLLSKMGREDVRVVHGSREKGKDILFRGPGGLNESRLYACVVKNEKIGGAAGDHDTGARTVLNQIQMSLSEPFIGDKGEQSWIDTVYVISPYECASGAVESIQHTLTRLGQVEFWCGQKLLSLFALHWPTFLWFESGVLQAYLSALKASLQEDSALITLIIRKSILAGLPGSFFDMYIPISMRREFFGLAVTQETLDTSRLSRPLRHAELKAFFGSLLDLRRAALYYNDCTGISKSHGLESAHTVVTSLMDVLETDWKHAFEAHIAQIQRDYAALLKGAGRSGKHSSAAIAAPPTPSPRMARVTVALSSKSQAYLKAAQDLDNTVRRLLYDDVARTPSEAPDQAPLAILTSDSMLAYCRATDFGATFPDRLTIGRSAGQLNLDHGFLDSYRGHLLVAGPAGFGKSSFCRWNVIRDSDRLVNDEADVLPVFVPLYTLAHRPLLGIDDAFFVSSDLRMLVQDPKRSTYIRLYLDGLDEVPDETRRAEIMDLAKRATETVSHLQVVATCRDHIRAAWLDWLPRVDVMPLAREQQERLVKNWLVKDDDVQSFFDELATCPPLQPLMAVPLLATLTAAVYKRRRNLPSNRTALYGLFIELLCGGWDTIKGVNRGGSFGSHDKQLILTRLAGLNHLGTRREASIADFRIAIKESLAALSDFWQRVLEEVLEDGLLTRAGEILLFNHLSFQEYLAAVDLNDPTGERPTQALREYLRGNDWWREVMLFYVALSARPDEMESWMVRTAKNLSPKLSPVAKGEVDTRLLFLREGLWRSHPHYKSRVQTEDTVRQRAVHSGGDVYIREEVRSVAGVRRGTSVDDEGELDSV